MHDRFKKPFRDAGANDRVRRQIAIEAARRLVTLTAPDAQGHLRDISESEYYHAKRRAAAVLGHRVRPGDLPADAEIRAQILVLAGSGGDVVASTETDLADPDADDEPEPVPALSDHLDRFTVYKMRLEPLEAVKQNPTHHPEGDALYHSLQVFDLARDARPYDEEFLLAALLHDVGKAIDPRDHVAAGLDALRGAISPRTAWLIEHHMDLMERPGRPLKPSALRDLQLHEHFDDLVALRDLDESGRVPGHPVGTIDEALAYIKGLESGGIFGSRGRVSAGRGDRVLTCRDVPSPSWPTCPPRRPRP